jgi:hypothetical protein
MTPNGSVSTTTRILPVEGTAKTKNKTKTWTRQLVVPLAARRVGDETTCLTRRRRWRRGGVELLLL